MRTGDTLSRGDKVVIRSYDGQIALGRVLAISQYKQVKVSWRWESELLDGVLESCWFGCWGQGFGQDVHMNAYESNERAEAEVKEELAFRKIMEARKAAQN
jgi:hypothetical protein